MSTARAISSGKVAMVELLLPPGEFVLRLHPEREKVRDGMPSAADPEDSDVATSITKEPSCADSITLFGLRLECSSVLIKRTMCLVFKVPCICSSCVRPSRHGQTTLAMAITATLYFKRVQICHRADKRCPA